MLSPSATTKPSSRASESSSKRSARIGALLASSTALVSERARSPEPRRSTRKRRPMIPPMARTRRPSNWAVLFPYVLPYFLYVGVLIDSREHASARLDLSPGARRERGRRSRGAGAGRARSRARDRPLPRWRPASRVASSEPSLWIAIKAPFYEAGGDAYAPAEFWARLAASATVVAVFEEKLFRGFVLLGAVQWDEARRAGSKDPLGEALHDRSIARRLARCLDAGGRGDLDDRIRVRARTRRVAGRSCLRPAHGGSLDLAKGPPELRDRPCDHQRDARAVGSPQRSMDPLVRSDDGR